MAANFRKLMSEVPRGLEVAARDAASDNSSRPGRSRVSKAETARRLAPVMGVVANHPGPVDPQTAEAIKAYIEGTRGTFEQ